MTSGIVVIACPALCTVSASKATDPLMAKMTTCPMAVTDMPASEIQAARMPSRLASSAVWIDSVKSWECGFTT